MGAFSDIYDKNNNQSILNITTIPITLDYNPSLSQEVFTEFQK